MNAPLPFDIHAAVSRVQHQLRAPARPLDAARWPVRGDLAHVALAGRCFVPHYAAPLPHAVAGDGVALRAAPTEGAQGRDTLAAGTVFDVLDVTGGWAWGLVASAAGIGGLVGYVPAAVLVPLTAGEAAAA